MGVLVILGVGLSVVDDVLLLLKELIQRLRSDAPAAQVEVSAILHSELQTALPLQALTGLLLAGEVGSGIEVDLALVGSILDVLGH